MSTRLALTSKLLVTVIVGGAVYLIAGASGRPEEWRITLAVVGGVAVLIIQYMIGLDRRLTALGAELRTDRGDTLRVIEDSFARISEATELYGQVETSPLRRHGVAKLVSNATNVLSSGPDIVRVFAREEVNRVAGLLEAMSDSSVERAGEDHDWIVALTECAASTVDAISTSMDKDFWETETAARYLRAQREAIQLRGVRIRRLFLLTEAGIDAELERQRDIQQGLGINVRVLALEETPHATLLGATNDFILFDQELSYEVVFDPGGFNATTSLNFEPERVSQRVRRFDALWAAAR